MEITTRMLDRETDGDAARRLDEYVWMSSQRLSPDHVIAMMPWRAMLGAFLDDRLIGMWGAHRFQLTVPGPRESLTTIPVEASTSAAVHPEARRRGALTQLIGHHLRRCREEGIAVTIHEASEPGIYRRFGYAPALEWSRLRLSGTKDVVVAQDIRDQAAATTVFSVERPWSTETRDRLHTLQVRAAASHVGGTSGSAENWEALARDDHDPHGKGYRSEWLIATRDGVDVGFAMISRTSDWTDGSPQGTCDVYELQTLDQGATLAILEHCTSFDLISTTRIAAQVVDGQVAAMFPAGPRTYGLPNTVDACWLRLVNLPSALMLRGYATPVDVVLDVTDAILPENAGRWRLTVDDDGHATCTRTDDAADLSLDTTHLAAAYLGAHTLRDLAAAGAVVEHTPGALTRTSRTLSTDRAAYSSFGY